MPPKELAGELVFSGQAACQYVYLCDLLEKKKSGFYFKAVPTRIAQTVACLPAMTSTIMPDGARQHSGEAAAAFNNGWRHHHHHLSDVAFHDHGPLRGEVFGYGQDNNKIPTLIPSASSFDLSGPSYSSVNTNYQCYQPINGSSGDVGVDSVASVPNSPPPTPDSQSDLQYAASTMGKTDLGSWFLRPSPL